MVNNKVDVYNGYGEFEDKYHVKINDKVIKGNKILISTGSKPMTAKFIKGYEHIKSSDDIFKMEQLPKSMIVIGAG